MFLLLPIAFVSGILTVFSPCVIPVLPIVLASGIDGNKRRVKGVITGLIISFTITILLFATIVTTLNIPADVVRNFAVALLVIFGSSMIFPVIWDKTLSFIEKFWKIKPIQKGDGFAGGIVTGASLGLVWTPCIGPVIAAVATLAAVNALSPTTWLIAFSYALGAGIPLYFIAIGGQKFTNKLGLYKNNSQKIRQAFGVVILLTALFIYSGADRRLQAWTLDNLPENWTQITTVFENSFNIDNRLKQLQGEAPSIEKGKPGEIIVRNVRLQDDFTGAKVDKSDLMQGCFAGKDCIPSIEDPKFDTAVQASEWLGDSDVVFAVDHEGIQRAYPQRILNWHEIVNDTISNDPIAITFCPLCGSALAFERVVDEVITEFGVSGKLHNSDLVMYDRYEGNLWQQITGEAIVGPAARRDEVLKQIPIITTTWREWRLKHPDTQVLSLDTGFSRNYNAYPYGTYEQDDELYFGVENLDRSLQIKTVVYGIEVNGASKAYPENVFDIDQTIVDEVGGVKVELERTEEGQIKVLNVETQEEITPIRLFWFAWAAFHPDTELYE